MSLVLEYNTMASGQVEESILIETVNGSVMEIPVILQIQ